MKKIILLSLLISSAFNNVWADVPISDIKGNKVNIKTDYKIIELLDFNDLNIAAIVGDNNYINNAIKKDANIILKINSINPSFIIGFNSKNIETIQNIKKYDNNLYYRTDNIGRNLLLNMLASHYDFIVNNKIKEENNKLKIEIKNKQPSFLSGLDEKLKTEDISIFLIKDFNKEQLNTIDNYKNNILHYAVYNRLLNVAQTILNNNLFTNKNSTNVFNENSLFTLLGNNCNVNIDKNKDVIILKTLLDNKVNPLQRNNQNYSFAAIVLAIDDFSYLRPTLLNNLSSLQKKLIEKEILSIKNNLNNKKLKNSFFSLQDFDSYYHEMECK